MKNQEILRFCLEKGFLLDKDVLNLFDETNDIESIKLIIQKIKESTNQKIITKNLFKQNKEKLFQIISSLPSENQQCLDKLKINLGLSIEISREVSLNTTSSVFQQEGKISSEKIKKEASPIEGIKIDFSFPKNYKKLEVQDFTAYFRNRISEMKKILQENSSLKNLVSINKLSNNRQNFSIIGIVSSKSVTKNKNIIFEIEDLTGKMKVLINSSNENLIKKAEEISLDSVLGFTGFGSREILFVSDFFFPEASLPERKKLPNEEYAVFLGDLHFGSKLFLEGNFLKFIDYLNGKIPNTPEVEKIKYLFLVGDIIAGVGNYPTQERDLKIKDIEEQFLNLSNILKQIRKDIKIIISPGNHDGVRLMEPQPPLNERYAWSFHNLDNVFLTGNPSYITIGETPKSSGIQILLYHGFSFPYYANTIPKLIQNGALNSPTNIMAYLLKNRHLAPTHSSVQYFPSQEDFLMIKHVPDIFVSGHTHKSGVCYYNNILLVSVSSWESKTSYQEKMGNQPDFCKVPLINLKTRKIKILDFEDEKNGEFLDSKKEELK